VKIVVTGALGHIGSRLIREIPASFPGAEVVLLDNLSTQRYISLFNLPAGARYRFVEGDVTRHDLQPLFQGAAAVIHLAAITDATNSFQNRELVEEVNLRGTERVARACIQCGSPLIFVSTTSVYGVQSGEVDEDCSKEDLKPQSPYAAAKLAAEEMLARLSATDGLRFVTFRFGTIYGTSVGMRFHTAINKFCWQAAMGQPITVWRTAMDQVRPYLDLGDAVRVFIYAIERQLFDGRIYNAVTNNLTIRNIVECISRHVASVNVQLVDTEIMNQLSYHVNSERIRRQGFEFKGDLDRGVAETMRLLLGDKKTVE
jgi:nucleoside-diphosphate-sugar epimerase